MGRTLSGPTSTATAQTITQPGYLVQLGFSSVLRYSSRGDEIWNGQNWLANNVQVGTISETPNGGVSLGLTIGNTDLAFGAVCLTEQPQDKAVSVWAFYEGAVALADPILIFDGVIDSCDISQSAVQLTLSDLNAKTLFIPRGRITRANGFNRLSPVGRVISFNGLRIELVRG